MRKRLPILLMVVMALILPFTVASAQFANPWVTSYMLQNLSNATANVVVSYYDANGNQIAAADKTLTIAPSAQVTVIQYTDDPNLPSGKYSAVVSSDQQIAAIVNQQTAPPGQTYMNSQPPFGSYSGASTGALTLAAPEVMYNWFNYYTQMYIQNTGATDAHVTISYIPGKAGTIVTGKTGQSDTNITIKPNASYMADQKNLAKLGDPAAPAPYTNRFNGSAIITSDVPIVAIVNEFNDSAVKLFSYNTFSSGSSSMSCPSILRGHYGWYTSLSIANPDPNPAHVANVHVVYTADNRFSLPSNLQGTTVAQDFQIAGGAGVLRYDGPGSNATQSDLTSFTRFFGDVMITSTGYPIVAKVNQESAGGNAESYNCVDTNTATLRIAVPMIQTKFYNFYTSLTIKNLDPTHTAHIQIAYKSDGTYSVPTNTSYTANHTIGPLGQFNSWEGGAGNPGDLWSSGIFTKFNGSAVITSDYPIIAIVNEEKLATGADYGYSFNVINLP